MMLRRTLLATIGLAAAVCLGGCVVHGPGAHGVQTKTPRHARVFNVKTPSHRHADGSHDHAGGDKAHSHNKPARNSRADPAHGGHRKSHGKSRYETRKNHKD